VRSDTRTIDAFRLMNEKNISGLAVVDPTSGAFVANTSSSDLKLYIKRPNTSLEQPLMDFLSKIRLADVNDKTPTIHVNSRSTLGHVIGLLAATKVHKVFVADQDKGFKPTSVISLSDILKTVLTLKR